MQEMGNPPDPRSAVDFGFVVEWQLGDENPALIDLSEAEAEMVLPDDVAVETGPGPTP